MTWRTGVTHLLQRVPPQRTRAAQGSRAMTSENRSNERPRHYGCLVLGFILLLLVLLAVALFWRSAWWTEAGAPGAARHRASLLPGSAGV